jgi:hypothetical protein
LLRIKGANQKKYCSLQLYWIWKTGLKKSDAVEGLHIGDQISDNLMLTMTSMTMMTMTGMTMISRGEELRPMTGMTMISRGEELRPMIELIQ